MKKHSFLLVLAAGALLASCGEGAGSSSSAVSSGEPGASSEIPSSEVTPSSLTSQEPLSSAAEGSSEGSSSKAPVTSLAGQGTASDPYLIGDAEELAYFAAHPVMDACYALTADIEYSGEWAPIGKGTSSADIFSGAIYGNGHKISGLRISSFQKGERYYGFFGYASGAYVQGLTLGMSIEGSLVGKDSTYLVGGFVGYGEDCVFDDCHVDYDAYMVSTLQNGSSKLAAGGFAGFLNVDSDQGTLFVRLSNSSVSGDIDFDFSDSDGVSSYLGGFAGMVSTGNYEGVYSLNNLHFDGSVTGGTYAGGILGYADNYVTVTNSYVEGMGVHAGDKDGAYAGGIAGCMGYETFVYGNYVDLEEVSAPHSSSTIYSSYANDLVGIAYEDAYAEDYDIMGTGFYANYRAEALEVDADEADHQAASSSYDAALASSMGFSPKIWDLSEHEILDVIDEDYQVSATIDLNGAEGEGKSISVKAVGYDANYAALSSYEAPKRAGYSYYGLSYDKEGQVPMRWYAPINSDVTLYCDYASVASLVGDYAYTCMYYDSPVGDGGHWKFDEENFYWLYNDGGSAKYAYRFNGAYIFIGDYLGEKEMEAYVGGYADEIFRYGSDGSVEAYDINDSDAVYTGVKDGTTRAVPDHTGASYLGDWQGLNSSICLYASGNALGKKNGSSVHYAGGFSQSGSSLHIYISSGIVPEADYAYDEAHGLLIGEKNLFSRAEIANYAATGDLSLRVVSAGGALYAIESGAVSSKEVSGSFEEGSLTVGSQEYAVKDGVLTPVTPESDNKLIAGTYDAVYEILGNKVSATLQLSEEGTGSIERGSGEVLLSFSFAYDAATNQIVLSNLSHDESREDYFTSLSLAYDQEKQSFAGSGMYYSDYEEYSFTITATLHVEEPEEESQGIAGVYEGSYKVFANTTSCKVVLGEDGSGKVYNKDEAEIMDFAYVYDEETGKITVTFHAKTDDDAYFETLTLSFDKTTKTLTGSGTYSYDYESYDYTLTATFVSAAPSTEKGIDAATVAGTYTGSWGYYATTSCTLTLSADGKGTFQNDSKVTMFSFSWAVDAATGELTISDFECPSYCYEDLKLTYKDGAITGTIYENEDTMAYWNISVSK